MGRLSSAGRLAGRNLQVTGVLAGPTPGPTSRAVAALPSDGFPATAGETVRVDGAAQQWDTGAAPTGVTSGLALSLQFRRGTHEARDFGPRPR